MTSQDAQGSPDSPDSQDKFRLDRDDEDHDFVDQSKIDFDPDDGLYSGTAVDGASEIPGPHMDTDSGELTGMDEVEQAKSEREEQQASSQEEHASSQDEPAPAGGRHRQNGG